MITISDNYSIVNNCQLIHNKCDSEIVYLGNNSYICSKCREDCSEEGKKANFIGIRILDATNIDNIKHCGDFLPKELFVKFAIYCAESVINVYENKYPNDNRPRLAIEAAKKWLNEPNEQNRKAATDAACAAAYAAANAAANAAYSAAYSAARAAAYDAYAAANAAYAANAASYAANAGMSKSDQTNYWKKLVSEH